jgi:hypothetical protein
LFCIWLQKLALSCKRAITLTLTDTPAGGVSLAEGVETLARFVGDAPVLAFHHGHDRDFLRAALNRA